jgi:hypothetical protein
LKAKEETMKTTIHIHGMKIRTASQRTYVVVAGRPEAGTFRFWSHVYSDYRYEHGEPFIKIVARSDSFETACKRADKFGYVVGGFVKVVDTRTGAVVY